MEILHSCTKPSVWLPYKLLSEILWKDFQTFNWFLCTYLQRNTSRIYEIICFNNGLLIIMLQATNWLRLPAKQTTKFTEFTSVKILTTPCTNASRYLLSSSLSLKIIFPFKYSNNMLQETSVKQYGVSHIHFQHTFNYPYIFWETHQLRPCAAVLISVHSYPAKPIMFI